MGFIGFIARRVLKAIVFKFIDETEYDPRVAKQKKQAASKIITAVGLSISLASFDFAGLLDALHDQGIDIAHETIAQAAEHGSDVADHASTFADHMSNAGDPHFGGGTDDYVPGYTYSPSTDLYYDSDYNYTHDSSGFTHVGNADGPYDAGNFHQDGHNMKFGSKGGGCSFPGCDCPRFLGGPSDVVCKHCRDTWHWHIL
jgi:hypothetical protein